MGNDESKPLHSKDKDITTKQSQNKDSVSQQSQNEDSIFLKLQNSDGSSFHLAENNSVTLQVGDVDLDSPQLHPAKRKGKEERFFSSLNNVKTSGQHLTSANSSNTQLKPNIAKNGTSNNVQRNIWSEFHEVTSKYPVTYEHAKDGNSSHSHDILTLTETLASNWYAFHKTNPTKHTTEKMEDGNVFRNNISEDQYKVANTYLWAHEQAKLCSSKHFSNPASTQVNFGNKKTALFAARQIRQHPSCSKKNTRPRQHRKVKDGMKYTCEIHKTTDRHATSHPSDFEEKYVSNLDKKLRRTHEAERKVELNHADILSIMSSLNRTDEAKWNAVEMQALNSQNTFNDVMFLNCDSSIDMKPSHPVHSDRVVSEDSLSLSLSAKETMYSAQRKYALKSKDDIKFTLRLPYLDDKRREYMAFTGRKNLHAKNSKLRYDAHIVRCLINDLINFNNFQADLGTLSKNLNKNPNELILLLKDNAGIFSLIVHSPTKATVMLRPKIRYCSERISAECQNIFCFAVHVCPYYIFDTCRVNNCKFGHALRTTKTNYIFKSFHLDSFSDSVLKGILRRIWAGTIYPKLCFAYNTGTCTASICMDLHLCYKHVMSLGLCPGVHTYCPLNHDIYDPCCKKVFKYFNISTNETPRDLMKYVMYTTKSLLTQPYYGKATDSNTSGFKLRNLFETLV